MKPRDSIPHTACTSLPCHGSARASMQRAKPPASASNGVTSRKVTPGLGKSATARTREANSMDMGRAGVGAGHDTGKRRSGRQPALRRIRGLVIVVLKHRGLVERQPGHYFARFGPDHV